MSLSTDMSGSDDLSLDGSESNEIIAAAKAPWTRHQNRTLFRKVLRLRIRTTVNSRRQSLRQNKKVSQTPKTEDADDARENEQVTDVVNGIDEIGHRATLQLTPEFETIDSETEESDAPAPSRRFRV